jgi:sec-independent protein translocase protein TatC
VPGLLKEERGLVLPLVVASTVLFYAGGTFGLLVLVPVIMNILLSFGTASMVPNIAVGQLLTFILRLVLACGTIFELPLVTTALALAGLLTGRDLLSKWRYAVVAIFVVAAVVTPGDGPSLLVLAIPMIILYFLSVGLAFLVQKRGRERERASAEAGPAIVPRPAAADTVPRPPAPPAVEPVAERAPGPAIEPAAADAANQAGEPPSEEP